MFHTGSCQSLSIMRSLLFFQANGKALGYPFWRRWRAEPRWLHPTYRQCRKWRGMRQFWLTQWTLMRWRVRSNQSWRMHHYDNSCAIEDWNGRMTFPGIEQQHWPKHYCLLVFHDENNAAHNHAHANVARNRNSFTKDESAHQDRKHIAHSDRWTDNADGHSRQGKNVGK